MRTCRNLVMAEIDDVIRKKFWWFPWFPYPYTYTLEISTSLLSAKKCIWTKCTRCFCFVPKWVKHRINAHYKRCYMLFIYMYHAEGKPFPNHHDTMLSVSGLFVAIFGIFSLSGGGVGSGEKTLYHILHCVEKEKEAI